MKPLLVMLSRRAMRRLSAVACATFVATCLAQVAAPAPANPETSVEELTRQNALKPSIEQSPKAAGKTDDEVVELTPFQVTGSARGYQATNTMSGTRLNSKLEDLAAPITVVTKQQLADTAAIDLNDIFSNEGNTEGIYQYTDFTVDRGFTVDNVAQTPETSNRIRGLGGANMASNGFIASRTIPVDTYNVDSVEISRGPNSNLFGLGEPSGTINLIRGRANLNRTTTDTSFRVDDRDSYRATIDFNQVLWKDKLAARFAAVHDHTEFVRKPSLDQTDRFTASLSYRPWKDTTIRASYESYRNRAQRANSVTPRDVYSEWKAAGSPVWDPTFSNNAGGWRLLNGTTYTAVTQANEVAQLPRGLGPQAGAFWARPSIYVNPDGSIGIYEVNRAANAPAAGVLLSPAAANATLRYMQIAGVIGRGGGVFGSPLLPLYQQPGFTDQSLYDWTEVNYAAPNSAFKEAGVVQVELEQWLVKNRVHQLAAQIGYMREDITNKSRAYIGASDGAAPTILIDVNEKRLDGSANPYFLMPYLAGTEMQSFSRPELNDQGKATLAYQLDLRDEAGWKKWAGRHNFAGYVEYRQRIFAPTGLRSRDQIVSDESWNTVTPPNYPGRGTDSRFYTRYYLGGAVNQAGSVVDYAPSAPAQTGGTRTLHWYNASLRQWVDDPVEIDEVYFSGTKQRNRIRSRGFIWQGFFLDDRLIPTLGFRHDKNTTVNSLAARWAPMGITTNPTSIVLKTRRSKAQARRRRGASCSCRSRAGGQSTAGQTQGIPSSACSARCGCSTTSRTASSLRRRPTASLATCCRTRLATARITVSRSASSTTSSR